MSDNQRLQVLPQSAITTQMTSLYQLAGSGKCLHGKMRCTFFFFSPSVNHLVTFLEPADPRHLTARSGSIHVDDQVIFSHKHLQAAHHIPAEGTRQVLGTVLRKDVKLITWTQTCRGGTQLTVYLQQYCPILCQPHSCTASNNVLEK